MRKVLLDPRFARIRLRDSRSHRGCSSERSRGFTLVELLVVIAIVGLMVAIIVPAVQASRESARRSQCASNLRQIGVALLAYHDARRGFPPGCIEPNNRRLAWTLFLLPYLEEKATYDLYDQQSTYYAAANHRATSVVVTTYLCPSVVRLSKYRVDDVAGDVNKNGLYDPGDDMAMTDYGGMFGWSSFPTYANGVMLYDKSVSLRQVSDGSAHTIIVAEDTGRGTSMNGPWADGENIFDAGLPINQLQNNEIWSDHPDGAQVLFCDGSVQFLSESLDLSVLAAMCTRAGGDVQPAPP